MRHPLLPVAIIMAIVILICEGCFGLFSNLRDPSRAASHYSHFVSKHNWMLVELCDNPTHGARSIHLTADVVEIANDSNTIVHPCRGKILLYLSPTDSVPTLGDRLLVYVRPNLPSASDNPHQFDYRQYLRRRGILYTAYVPANKYHVVGHSDSAILNNIASLRSKLIAIIQSSPLSPDERGIAEALFLGWDDDLQPDTEASFRASGITHLLCVSGLHVGIVALLAGYCLFFLSNSRRHRIIKGCFQLLVIWFFVLLTGMAPGTTRAGLMFSLFVIGRMFFTSPPALNTIAASAVILLSVNPLLLFDVGFQLSYCAVIAIVLLVPPLERIVPIPKGNNSITRPLFWLLAKLRSLVCVSIAAQLAIAPFTLYYFHNFPPYFLVANIIIVPFAALLLGSVLLMVLFSWWPWLFNLLGTILSAELSLTSSIASTIASWPHALIEGIYFDQLMMVLLLAIIVALVVSLIRRSPLMLTIALALALPFVIHCRLVEWRCASQRDYTIYNLGNRTAIEFFAGHESYLLCDSTIASNPQAIDYQTANNLLFHKAKRTHILQLDTTFDDGILSVKNRLAAFNGQTIKQY